MKHFTDYRIRCAKCKTIPYIDEIIYHKYGFITYHCKCGVHYISLSCFMNNLCVKSNEEVLIEIDGFDEEKKSM